MTTATAPLPLPLPAPTKPPPVVAAPVQAAKQEETLESRIRRLSVAEYHDLIDRGFFARDERYELLEGFIVQKMTRGSIHDASLGHVRRFFDRIAPPGWFVRVQSAVTTDDSEPEPDLAVVRGTDFDYLSRHPGHADTALLVEIGNTSTAEDRKWKGRLYARAGFAVYWILNLADRRIEVYTDPTGPDPAPAYRRREDYGIGQSVPLTVGGVAVAAVPVADLLPPVPPTP